MSVGICIIDESNEDNSFYPVPHGRNFENPVNAQMGSPPGLT